MRCSCWDEMSSLGWDILFGMRYPLWNKLSSLWWDVLFGIKCRRWVKMPSLAWNSLNGMKCARRFAPCDQLNMGWDILVRLNARYHSARSSLHAITRPAQDCPQSTRRFEIYEYGVPECTYETGCIRASQEAWRCSQRLQTSKTTSKLLFFARENDSHKVLAT